MAMPFSRGILNASGAIQRRFHSGDAVSFSLGASSLSLSEHSIGLDILAETAICAP